MNRKIFLIITVFAVCSLSSDEPSQAGTKFKAEQVFDLSGLQRYIDDVEILMLEAAAVEWTAKTRKLVWENGNDEARTLSRERFEALIEAVSKKTQSEFTKEEFVSMIDKEFSDQELDVILNFCETDIGKRFMGFVVDNANYRNSMKIIQLQSSVIKMINQEADALIKEIDKVNKVSQ